jgi:hypothetical protein
MLGDPRAGAQDAPANSSDPVRHCVGWGDTAVTREQGAGRQQVREKSAAPVEGSPQALKRGCVFGGSTARLNVVPFPIPSLQ